MATDLEGGTSGPERGADQARASQVPWDLCGRGADAGAVQAALYRVAAAALLARAARHERQAPADSGDTQKATCQRCGVDKRITEFPRDTTKGINGRRKTCKACGQAHQQGKPAFTTWPGWMQK